MQVPKFLHVTAKCTRMLIEIDGVDPLHAEEEVDIGDPDLGDVASECQGVYTKVEGHGLFANNLRNVVHVIPDAASSGRDLLKLGSHALGKSGRNLCSMGNQRGNGFAFGCRRQTRSSAPSVANAP